MTTHPCAITALFCCLMTMPSGAPVAQQTSTRAAATVNVSAQQLPRSGETPSPPFRDPALPINQRIANLLSLMTLDEKMDCLSTRTGVPRLGVSNFGNSEGIHGVVQRGNSSGRYRRSAITTTQFPQQPGIGETWDPALVQQAGHVEA